MSTDDEYNTGDENDLETIIEGTEEVPNTEDQAVEEVFGDENNENQADGAADEQKEVVKPKRVIRNPQPKLNEQTLRGKRGFSAIEGYFERVKFKGKGYEEQDLNVLMKTYEYWCHRLFPKFPFDSCIERLEKLGTKRGTQTQIKKIRMGITDYEEDKPLVSDEEENDTGGFVDTTNDPFDQLLPTVTRSDQLRQSQIEISAEQEERIRQNREKAERLRQERLKKIRDKAQLHVEDSNRIDSRPSTSESQNLQSDVNGHGGETINQKEDNDEEGNVGNISHVITSAKEATKKNILDSDSDDETTRKTQHSDDSEDNVVQKKTARNRRALESDSEDDMEDATSNSQDPKENSGSKIVSNLDSMETNESKINSQNTPEKSDRNHATAEGHTSDIPVESENEALPNKTNQNRGVKSDEMESDSDQDMGLTIDSILESTNNSNDKLPTDSYAKKLPEESNNPQIVNVDCVANLTPDNSTEKDCLMGISEIQSEGTINSQMIQTKERDNQASEDVFHELEENYIKPDSFRKASRSKTQIIESGDEIDNVLTTDQDLDAGKALETDSGKNMKGEKVTNDLLKSTEDTGEMEDFEDEHRLQDDANSPTINRPPPNQPIDSINENF